MRNPRGIERRNHVVRLSNSVTIRQRPHDSETKKLVTIHARHDTKTDEPTKAKATK
jgi:hypothetical protein